MKSKDEHETESPEATQVSGKLMRITGRDVEIRATDGSTFVKDRGDVVSVDVEQARELFQQGNAVPEDMRPEGAPAGVEKR